ncbi:M16 family metallopeptidase [Mesorhizobium huakuii]|uniref:Insulinase family protein n=1 Tax=Mesorhizobium huakuii TaxID=28104 RepID=A0A7G6T6P8_9HYPH|nr:pitrilysin family protein [Mesorhizobium huakuii]QND62430.1 insulinase family protein [Mesorhizobium huakuii]QND69752.1 insulinase family protein [Mesorhizobium loti]
MNQHRAAFAQALPFPLSAAQGSVARFATPLVIVILAILFLILPALRAHAAMNIQEVKSEKGITAWLVEDHTLPIVTMDLVFDGGTTQDPAGKEGLANLMTGLLDEGAGDLDSETFQVQLDDAGAEMSFDAQRDGIHGSMRLLSERQNAAFDLVRLAVNRPRFDKEPVERIRAQLLSEIIANEREPHVIAELAWLRRLYGTHPYSRPPEGTKQSLAHITPADLSAFHKTAFGRDGLHVAVVGDIDAKALSARLDQLFGDLPQKQALAPVSDVTPKLGGWTLVKSALPQTSLPQTSLQLAFPGIGRSDPEFYAAQLINNILGGSPFTSRLFQEVREKRGLAYGVSSSLEGYQHSNTLVVTTSTRADRAAETLDLIRQVIKELVDTGPTSAELEASKKYLIGAYAINNLGSSSSISATLVELQLDNLGTDYIQRRPALIEQVTLDQVRAAAKKLLSAEPAIMVVGPPLGGKG